MPITVTAPRGQLTALGEREIVPELTAVLLEATSATGNEFLTSIIGGTLHLLDPEDVYVAGKNQPLILVEVKLPAVALSSEATRATFIAAATDVVERLTVAGQDRGLIWVNVVHAAEGGWGLGGRAYTGADLIAAAENGSASV